jgi:hypothetical protein
MKKIKLLGLFVGGFVLGAIATGRWSTHLFTRLTVAKEVEVALLAAQEANWLALLRLNEPQTAIQDMENSMDIRVSTISQWAEGCPPDAKTRQARDRLLTSVKVYHENYPASGPGAARVNALLAGVPGRNPGGTCTSGLCRLDDLRLGTGNTGKIPATK